METRRGKDNRPFVGNLETFLVEWKLKVFGEVFEALSNLETFLVEWKPTPAIQFPMCR